MRHDSRDWPRTLLEKFAAKFNAYLEWYADERLKSFREARVTVYDTIKGGRRKLDHAVLLVQAGCRSLFRSSVAPIIA